MGLPNIKRNADKFEISSTPGKGTSLKITICLDSKENK
jgi:anti-sigma regulatory factor (Ser/Thr protein kinase)